jgi:hypothetical protein
MRPGFLQFKWLRATSDRQKESVMGINDERDIEANLQIGPTDQGMVRLFVASTEFEVPMDFSPEEAEEIAEEIRAAAAGARKIGGGR